MEKFRKGVGILLILIGVLIIGNVFYKKLVTAQKQRELIQIFESGISEGKTTGNGGTLSEANGYTPIAIMEIPSIKLSQGVVDGITDHLLQYYLGHFPDSAMPGQAGNFSVAGHRVSDYTDAFINLYKVKPGDEVIVKTNEKKYIYVVEEIFIVKPEQVEVLDNTEDATMTLVTCTIGAKERVIVKGKLKTTEEIKS